MNRCYGCKLRIKVTLDPDVEWLLREAMREKSISFQEALKEAARAGFRKPGQGEARRLAPGLRGLWAFIEPRTTDSLRPVRFCFLRVRDNLGGGADAAMVEFL